MNTAIVTQRARPARLSVAGLLLLALLCGLRAAPPARAALPSAIGRIAFVSNRFTGNPELYVMNADGSGLVRLTNNNAGEFSPIWSPDGPRIAFVSTRDNDHEINVTNADGTGQTNLSNHTDVDFDPDWEPLPSPPLSEFYVPVIVAGTIDRLLN